MKKKTLTIKGSIEKPILIDYTYNKENCSNGVVVFSHGFKGFKDWGPFNKIAAYFTQQGYVFVKFNFSHNGTTPENPIDFVDLKAFGNNNFSKELDDLKLVLNWVEKKFPKQEITLFGHSRGGAISMLKQAEDNRVSKVVSWASPSNLLNRLPKGEKQEKWKTTNIAYIYNGRTKQNMPMNYQFYLDCKANAQRLNIEKAVSNMQIPHLVVHGSDDPTVLIAEANNVKKWNSAAELYVIKGANHVFDGCHPFNSDVFPKDLQEAIDVTIKFLKDN